MRNLVVRSICLFSLLLAGEITSQGATSLRSLSAGGQSPFIITDPKNVTNVVEGETATFTVVAGGTEPLEYQWQKDSQPVAGATAPTLTLTDLASGSASYRAIVRNAFGSVTSNPALLLVWRKVPPVFTGGPSSQKVTEGQFLALHAFLVSAPPTTYQWSRNGVPIPSATQSDLIIPLVTLQDAGEYVLSATNPFGSVKSDPATVTVTPQTPTGQPPSIASGPDGGSAPEGGNFTFSVVPQGSQPITFQWFKDSVAIPGAHAQSFALTDLKIIDGGDYQVVISNAYGNATSHVAKLVVSTGGLESSVGLADDFNDATMDADKWVKGTLSLYQGSSITDSSIQVLEENSVDNNGYLKIIPTNGVSGLHYHGYVSKGTYDFTGRQLAVEIVQIPNSSSTAEMFFSAGPDGNNLYRFEIQMGQLRADLIVYGNLSSTELGPYNSDYKHLRIRHDPSKNLLFWEASSDRIQWETLCTRLYAFAVTNVQIELSAGTSAPANSPGLAIFDNVELSKIPLLAKEAPYILTQPEDAANVVEGNSVTFAVVAGGTQPLTYQWLKDSQPIPGATTSSLNLSDIRRGKGMEGTYQVTVGNTYGSVTSDPALLRIGSAGLPVIISGGGFRELQAGQLLTLGYFLLSAQPITYQWFKNGEVIPGATQAELKIGPATVKDGGVYRLKVTNPYGSAMGPIETVIITGRTTGPPLLASQPPAAIVIRKGEPLTLTTVVNGEAPFQFKWLKDSHELPGATSTTFAISASQLSDTGTYQFTVINSRGSASTEKISVLVLGAGPVFTVEPPEQTVLLPAQSVSLQIEVRAYDTPTISWYHNGQKQPEHSIWTLEPTKFMDVLGLSGWGGLSRVVPADEEGDWFVVASDSTGTTTSKVAHVEVVLPTPKRPPTSSTPDLRNDLVAYWPLDDAVDGKTKDAIGHYDLVLSNVLFAPARNQAGLQFSWDRTNQTATFLSNTPEDELPINRHPAFTISLWNRLYPFNSTFRNVPYFFREGDTEDPATVFGLIPDFKDGLESQFFTAFRFVQRPTENVDVITNRYISAANDWRHLVFVQEENGKRWFYIDGIESDIDVPPKPPGTWKLNYTQLGGSETLQVPALSALTFFCCFPHSVVIDDVAVWKRALSADEIQLLMATEIPGFKAKPLAIKSLAFKDERKTVVLGWDASGDGLYSLLRSASVIGPWTEVTNGYPYGVNGYTVTNSFTDTATEGPVFYRIRETPR